MRTLDETELLRVSGGFHIPFPPWTRPPLIVPLPGQPFHEPSRPPEPLPYPWFPPIPMGF
ncbi:MAG: hypothetical protein OXJ53_13395 [Gammaproteobacteria bacterium]|nr:hypothetical protein [Gammaproteobacteria bacterium]MDD9961378.1 hypothetical protein [Gammaproteobacteria bacterium]MDE0272765.1 hypothetical protein [Gammaproteobacteria bacterium]